ncbi:MAG: patatin-like phospholipase family protein [Lautropia sp.]
MRAARARAPARRHLLRAIGGVGLAGGLGVVAGCTLRPDRDHAGEHAPWLGPPREHGGVAWVFSSGGPRGFTHVGFLKAAAELGLVPDLIVGASAGALIGALRAAAMPAARIESLAMGLELTDVVRLALNASERFSGAGLADFIREQVADAAGVTRIEALPIAFAAVAMHRPPQGGEPEVVAFNHGDVGVAVQASAALEGRLTPVRIRGRVYVDADAAMPMPVRVARTLGARTAIAVDASAHEERAPPGAERYRVSDLRKRQLVAADATHADLVLHPDFGYWVSLSQSFRARAIAAGYRETMAAADRLRRLHARAVARAS